MIINDLDGYYIVFDTKNWNTELDTLINNAGKELFEVYKIDNGPDYVSDGLFRIVGKNSKIGFADTCGAIVIPPVFSYATPFHNGEAKVSFGGKNEKQGEYQSWKSNLWFLIKKSK